MKKNNTNSPEIDIVSFDHALELCKIGFNEDAFCMYEIENRQLCLCHLDEDGLYMPDKDLHAPTKSQVFRWFREKYRLYSTIIFRVNMEDNNEYWDWLIKGEEVVYRHFKTYEEAEDACIYKLIELVKEKNQ